LNRQTNIQVLSSRPRPPATSTDVGDKVHTAIIHPLRPHPFFMLHRCWRRLPLLVGSLILTSLSLSLSLSLFRPTTVKGTTLPASKFEVADLRFRGQSLPHSPLRGQLIISLLVFSLFFEHTSLSVVF
ncbi:unnamed protein product, partial [Prunus brigantina]